MAVGCTAQSPDLGLELLEVVEGKRGGLIADDPPLAVSANFDKKSALMLFQIVNNIFTFLIGKKQIDAVFSNLPEDKIKKISERDQKL